MKKECSICKSLNLVVQFDIYKDDHGAIYYDPTKETVKIEGHYLYSGEWDTFEDYGAEIPIVKLREFIRKLEGVKDETQLHRQGERSSEEKVSR